MSWGKSWPKRLICCWLFFFSGLTWSLFPFLRKNEDIKKDLLGRCMDVEDSYIHRVSDGTSSKKAKELVGIVEVPIKPSI